MKKYDPLMYIVVRRDLDMPAGKLAAQVGHATCRLVWRFRNYVDGGTGRSYMNLLNDWFAPNIGNEAKIVLGVDSLEELYSIQKKAHKMLIPTELVEDAAHTIFNEPTITCLGIGPLTQDEAKKFKYLRLY